MSLRNIFYNCAPYSYKKCCRYDKRHYLSKWKRPPYQMKPTELCEQICSRYKNHKLTHNRYNHAEYCFSKCLKYSTDDNTVPCDKIMYADCPKCRYTNLKQIIRCTKHSKQNLWNTLKKNKTDKCKTKCNKKTELYRFCHTLTLSRPVIISNYRCDSII